MFPCSPRQRVEVQPERPAGDVELVEAYGTAPIAHTATLVPEVSIGLVDGPDEYLFGYIASIAMATDGTIYVMDRDVPALRVYNADGTYRTTFGRGGGGPSRFLYCPREF